MKRTAVNDYWIRLALVVNTGHSRFNDNLASIIIYTLYSACELQHTLSADDIREIIRNKLGLEFTTKEIYICVKEKSNYFIDRGIDKISLSEDGAKKIHMDRNNNIASIFQEYKETFNIKQSIEEVSSLLYNFLYGCLGQNITDFLAVIQKESALGSSSINVEGFDNNQRKIINDFIDWNNSEKNQMLFQLVSFAVDYCRLTVKKDANSFRTILQGKVFYLDANIIFRLMGVNNAQRQGVVKRFVEKCKDLNIKLCYTTLTRKEVLDAINHHIRGIKKVLVNYHGGGRALNILRSKTQWGEGFTEAYLEWCAETKGYGQFDDFKQHLKSIFFKCVSGMLCEDAENMNAEPDEINEYFAAKNNQTSEDTAKYDIKNVKYIQKMRRRNSAKEGWNTKEYLISADHKLIDWSAKHFDSTNPIVVLPSVWYSAILKITGRTDGDDIRSFAEFIKIRYMQYQYSQEENINYLIKTICEKTPSGVLQDMLLTEISESNSAINKLFVAEKEEIKEIINSQYDDILEKTKKDGYSEGHNNGISEGHLSGVEVGEKIGRLRQRKEELINRSRSDAIKKCNRNKGILAFLFVLYIVGIFVGGKCSFWSIDKYNGVIRLMGSFFITTPVGYLITRFFPTDLKKLTEDERLKIDLEIGEIDSQLKIYQPVKTILHKEMITAPRRDEE